MVFQARKWGWKRVAAKLLLIPVLAGGSAAIAHAQPRSAAPAGVPAGPQMRSNGPAAPAAGRTGDPKQLLKDGRKALADGRFNDAQDLARAAAANNPTGKWGLFDDTPNALLKDVEEARLKADKAQAEQLMKQAKALVAKPAQNDAERAYNLDNALQMARRADQLHGPYSVWDVGDRPDKLVKDIESARAKLRTSPVAVGPQGPLPIPTPPNSAVASNGPNGKQPLPPPPSGIQPAGGPLSPKQPGAVVNAAGPNQPSAMTPAGGPPKFPNGPTAPAAKVEPKKAAAQKLLAEGRQLADQGNFAAAKAKYLEADKSGAVFTVNEPNPGFALQELNVRGTTQISVLIREANTRIAQKDYEKAHLALNTAGDIVTALGLFPRPVEEARATLRTASGGKYGGTNLITTDPAPVSPTVPPKNSAAPVATNPMTPATNPVATNPLGPVAPAGVNPMTPVATNPVAPSAITPKGPTTPPGVANVNPMPTATPPQAGGTVTGRQLLDQAAFELQKGELEMARKLALQAHNLGGVQEEARGLLNTIDAEALAMKQRSAAKSFEAAVQAHANKDYGHALSVCVLIDPNLLPADKRSKHAELVTACRSELGKAGTPGADVVATAGTQQEPGIAPPVVNPVVPPVASPLANPPVNPPGTARVGPGAQPDPNSLTNQVEAMRKVAFQKLRSDGLKVQADAQAAFGRGETDVAIQMLVDYANRVRSATDLDPASIAMLLRPIDSRLEMFRVMKGQADALAREKKSNRDAKELIVGRGAAEEQRKAEVQRLVRDYNRHAKAGDYAAAERAALQAKQLDPDNEAVAGLAHMAKMNRRVKEQEALKDAKEKMVYQGLTNAEQPGPIVTTEEPVSVQIQAALRARMRGNADDFYLKSRTPREFEIELQLDKPVSLEFNQTPLELAVENLRSVTGLPIIFEYPALEKKGLSPVKPVTVKPGAAISARNLLTVTLEQAGMGFVIEHDMIKITSMERSVGRLYTKVFSIADLVTPVPNFALPDYTNLDKMLNRNPLATGHVQLGGMNGPTPHLGANSLQGGVPAGVMANNPGISGGVPFGPGGTLNAVPMGNGNGPSPLLGSANLAPDSNTKHQQLIKLITGMIKPYSWDGQGGNGRVEYYDVGSALVVNQTADVIREVADLLEALRRLQDLAIAVEIRIISLSETFFERMGVDFAMNVKTHTAKFEPNLTSGIFRPEPFINDINNKGVVVGLSPAGAGGSGPGVGPSFTPDLDVPIRATSFNYAIPGFGSYPNAPGLNGGVSLGLAFLNDIQVYMFMEAAQGDKRVNVMQAPKLTLFNGQTASMTVSSLSFFVTSVSVVSVNGQLVFVPVNTALPGPDTNFSLAIQAVVSADRRFVRMNIPITLAAETGATVPLFPITTFITPVFEGGSVGVPIPFTQFLQQPSFTTLTINTTVVCPDGGTVLLGGLKTLKEGRNEYGPPFLSKIPYINRLFKNVGIGRETTHIMIMVTPRIIINREEEFNQTEGGQGFGVNPGP